MTQQQAAADGDDPVSILVMSLKEREMKEVETLFSSFEAFGSCTVATKLLQRSQLRGFKWEDAQRHQLVVIVHRNEGRVLLTDRNGFYNDVLAQAWKHCGGHVLLILTKAPVDNELFDEKLIRNLADGGGQPTTGVLSDMGRVLTWDSEPSKEQQKHLASLVTSAADGEDPMAAHEGFLDKLPPDWTKVDAAPLFQRCNIL
mmetsp:Transcript_121809/g.279126  ORF Transcript_121809/g.279126 Transcript_121809/m.279126 type:complete len:201 (-) Transcript_121809:200-802(-)